ncbi:MAG TPA: hypothetical protein VFC25_02965 [Verrucomicrobiae bacterium]|nr:hypothetical protein [Verrucomicrobiae bacterium]
MLAERLLSYIEQEPSFIVPSGQLVDQLELAPTDAQEPIEDSLAAVTSILSRRPPATTSLLYLTSDAGEGKTTLINQLARLQAQAYREKRSDWLLVPVPLAGRPFLRFDDIVVGALLNRLRFQLLYYDSFLEMVRLGVLVPALDGFEELFIERGTGDAVSALGTLLRTLESSGTLLIAARKAYYEYASLETQARLYDSLESASLSVARISLNRWDRSRFIEFSRRKSVPDGQLIYDMVAGQLGDNHPLLTRAVLVKQLLDLALKSPDRSNLLRAVKSSPKDFFSQFVRAIVEREANQKWIDRVGEPPRALLSVEEHCELLSEVAQEMWLNSTDYLKQDILQLVSELFSERTNKTPSVTRQIQERLPQHALLMSPPDRRGQYAFDHEEFFHFFLGEGIGRLVVGSQAVDLRTLFRKGRLPDLTLETAARKARVTLSVREAVVVLLQAARSEGPSSYVRENIGGLIIYLLDGAKEKLPELEDLVIPEGSLLGRELRGVTFRQCYFEPQDLEGASIDGCEFEKCRFERLEMSENCTLKGTVIRDCKFTSLLMTNKEATIYEPEAIRMILTSSGAKVVTQLDQPSLKLEYAPDERLVLSQRVFRAFLRATEVNEAVLRMRLGPHANKFFDDLMPLLVDSGIIREVDYHGAGNQRRYRLSRRLQEITAALQVASNSFDTFIRNLQNRGAR